MRFFYGYYLCKVLNLIIILSVLGTTVLVHGDAGTDATLQVTSLVQILLDPVSRTIKG